VTTFVPILVERYRRQRIVQLLEAPEDKGHAA
jgi:hypothetical protein